MTSSKQTQMPDRKAGTRYAWITRYETETANDLQSNETAGGVKNFPSTFIPMKELEESSFGG